MSGLIRSLEPRHMAMISIGGIIGAGLFVGSSAAIAVAGPAVVLSYAIAGSIVLLIMQMLGEMAVALPQVRSFTEFARVGLGDAAGFLAGWLYWYFWIVVIPVEAIAGAALLHQWIALPSWAIGVALMSIMALVNLLSARSYGEFEFWFASIKVAAIIGFIALAAAYLSGLTPHASPALTNLTRFGGFTPKGWFPVLAAVASVFFAMTGAEVATVAAAESSEPSRAIARMSRSIIVRILFFYVSSILLVVCVVPWSTVKVGESPFALALTGMSFQWASTAMSVLILTAVLSCLNSAFYVCARVLFVLADRGDAPQWLVHLNSRGAPARSVYIGWLAGTLGVLAQTIAPESVFAFLVNASGGLMIFIYLLIACSHWRLRRQWDREHQRRRAMRMWLFPWTTYLSVAAMLAVLVSMAFSGHAQEFYASFTTLAVVCVGWRIVRAQRGRRPLERPVPHGIRDLPQALTPTPANVASRSPPR